MSVDPVTRRTTLLQKDARIGDLAFNRADRSLWGIRQLNGLCTLVRIPPPYREWKQIHTFPYGTVVYDLDVSADGTRIAASFGEISGEQNVRVLSVDALAGGDVTPRRPVRLRHGRPEQLRVLAGRTVPVRQRRISRGVSNIFRYEIDAKKLERAHQHRDRVLPADSARRRRADRVPVHGRGVRAGANRRPRRSRTSTRSPSWANGSSRIIRSSRTGTSAPRRKFSSRRWTTRKGVYRPGRRPAPRVVLSDRAGLQGFAGVRASGSTSPTGCSSTGCTSPRASVPTATCRRASAVHASAVYERFDWRARGDLEQRRLLRSLRPDEDRPQGVFGAGRPQEHAHLRRAAASRAGSQRERRRQSRSAPRIPERRRRRRQAVFARGKAVVHGHPQLTRVGRRRDRDEVLGRHPEPDRRRQRVAESSRHVSIAVSACLCHTRRSGCAARPATHSARTDQPFADFFFGAFGNNWVDHGDEKRYRQSYAFPGLDLNALGGRSFLKSTVEWNLPPWRFSRLGTPGAYVAWLRPAVFAGGLGTDVGRTSTRRFLTNLGAQIDLRMIVLSELEMTLSVGGAFAFEKDRRTSREGMISLKILR